MAVDTPLWVTVAGSFGAGALVGNIVSYFLTSRLQRRIWILDNKKAEWRELIEEIHTCRDLMAKAFKWRAPLEILPDPEERKHVVEGMVRGSRIINNRIFIADVLAKHEIPSKWNSLSDMTYPSADNLGMAGLAFVEAFAKLADEIPELARRDLTIVSAWKNFHRA